MPKADNKAICAKPRNQASRSPSIVSAQPTLLFVPGLRDAVAQHWQTLLAAQLPNSRTVPPMGRTNLSCAERVAALEREASAIAGGVVIVAHSGGCITVAHWALQTQRLVHAALLAAPPDFETPLPEGYPSLPALHSAGWLPVPRAPLPFASLVAASRNDPLARFERAEQLAQAWGSELVDLGDVGHLNPASGYGEWPQAKALIARLVTTR